MISPMATTLVGENLSLEKRPNAIGWIISASAISYLIGTPFVGWIASFSGWRETFIIFMLPISLMSLILVYLTIPSKLKESQKRNMNKNYTKAFKTILLDRSAVFSLICNILSMASWMAILYYGASFLRQQFLLSTISVSILTLFTALSHVFGSAIGGKILNKVGRKVLALTAVFLVGVFTILTYNILNIWLTLIFRFAVSLFNGFRVTASNSLNLEQAPKFRGTMMSLSYAATYMGSALGAGLGGIILLFHNYEFMGVVLGTIGIVAAIIYYLFVVEPVKNSNKNKNVNNNPNKL
jgi:predicted MFS family arabinose efflux permease